MIHDFQMLQLILKCRLLKCSQFSKTSINKQIDDLDDWKGLLSQQVADFEYQGVNLNIIANTIYSTGGAAGRSKVEIQKDVASMILLFFCKEINVDKMMLRLSKAGKIKINDLKNAYRMVFRWRKDGFSTSIMITFLPKDSLHSRPLWWFHYG